ncbi:hypothetical protein HNP92_001780 [Methanococcus maripaludis]|uniref:Uncharacterized protein n=1 Tax=Methanococcus maripaludis TaxID=39152 RepID=A0A7J9SBR1_METMI|nr:hypothetical protein [Methanococcus maripaludis]MBB6402458.1 hypothetical protein [Methanococcus maripaludis]
MDEKLNSNFGETLNSEKIFGDEDFKRIVEQASREYDIDINKPFKEKFKEFVDTWSEIIEDIKNNTEGMDHYNTSEFEYNKLRILVYLEYQTFHSVDEKLEYIYKLDNLTAKLNYAVLKAQSRYKKDRFKEYSKLREKALDISLELLKKIGWH